LIERSLKHYNNFTRSLSNSSLGKGRRCYNILIVKIMYIKAKYLFFARLREKKRMRMSIEQEIPFEINDHLDIWQGSEGCGL
jgi:hypothetical protein